MNRATKISAKRPKIIGLVSTQIRVSVLSNMGVVQNLYMKGREPWEELSSSREFLVYVRIDKLKAEKYKREPTLAEVYQDSHMTSGRWIDDKSKDRWEKFTNEYKEGEGMDPDVVWVKQNLNKKGRIYGVGDLAPILKKTVETIPSSQPDPPDVSMKVEKLCEDVSSIRDMTMTLSRAFQKHEKILAINVKAGKLTENFKVVKGAPLSSSSIAPNDKVPNQVMQSRAPNDNNGKKDAT